MKPFQFKMTTGSIYVGFPGYIDEYGMFPVLGACSSTYMSKEGRYDLRGIFTPTEPVYLNIACVQARQECQDTNDSTMAYCRFLGTLVSVMREDEQVIPEIFLEYIKHIDPYFIEEFEGVGIIDAGAYDHAVLYQTDDQERLRLKLERIAREYRESLRSENVEKSCSDNVVPVNFGSNKNAPEKG